MVSLLLLKKLVVMEPDIFMYKRVSYVHHLVTVKEFIMFAVFPLLEGYIKGIGICPNILEARFL